MKNTDFTEPWTAMQKMFIPTSAISAPFRENAQRFWDASPAEALSVGVGD
jgi:hypothetical protein